ncbi:bacteriocin immunity protein [Lactococcus termiticola]|uniref:Uncharacterized protein n=1 Tax=Lactococcus termiticola TaxID=2169526 RepID=A0A2R5HEV6_9LACT|nr:bacteriocin immunity protein [Lactococcus termiticola]GBG96562.1 hypothetical protein NtB2_00675 [Lactococcus termiticola]
MEREEVLVRLYNLILDEAVSSEERDYLLKSKEALEKGGKRHLYS